MSWSRRRRRVVTPAASAARADARQAVMNARTHCHRGHEFTAANTIATITVQGRPGRVCVTCETIWHQRNAT